LGSADTATLSFAANINNLGNEGVGGLSLQEAGYSSVTSEYFPGCIFPPQTTAPSRVLTPELHVPR